MHNDIDCANNNITFIILLNIFIYYRFEHVWCEASNMCQLKKYDSDLFSGKNVEDGFTLFSKINIYRVDRESTFLQT